MTMRDRGEGSPLRERPILAEPCPRLLTMGCLRCHAYVCFPSGTGESVTTRPPWRHGLVESARSLSNCVRHALHRYGADLHRYTKARLSEAEADAVDEWPYFIRWSVAGSAALIGATHLVEWLGLRSENDLASLLGVGLGLLVGGLGIALLAWIYWRIQLDPEDKKPYVVAMLTSLATVGACVVAFAGLTIVLWKSGAINSNSRGSPAGLLEVEVYYLWHLVDTIPLVGATDALHWESPLAFSDPWSGGLLLTFKVLLLIPLIRVLLSGFRLVTSSWLSRAQRRARGRHPRDGATKEVARTLPGVKVLVIIATTLGGLLLLIGLPLFAYRVLTFVVRRSSYTDRWMETHLPGHVEFLGMTTSTWWLHVAVAVAGAWLVLAMAWGLADEILTEYEVYLESETGSRLGLRRRSFVPCWLTLLATMGAVAVTLILIRAGLAGADPHLRRS